MKRLAPLTAFAMLAACEAPAIESSDGGRNDGRTVDLVAVAPDGTHLWRFNEGARDVYFASSGTQRTVSCGKNCNRAEHVATVERKQ